ncbi:MAG TPA: xanthine dehydrogenase family protein subunit M, partial [Acidimicrobiales bacterium]
MSVVVPGSLPEVHEAIERHPDAQLLAGGTDFMVEVNFGHRRPTSVVALSQVPELRGWRVDGDTVVIGACCTYRELEQPELAAEVPALAQAARTVGSPQIRNAGTIGGNLATASPAGDTLPALAALDARIVVASSSGVRTVGVEELVVGPKRTTLQHDDVIVEIHVPVVDGPQEFLKIGTRNAMVIAVAGLALVLDRAARTVRCALGSVGPTVLRARDAEEWVAGEIDWHSGTLTDPGVAAEFGRRVAAAARPIDDHRSTAAYRRHGIEVLAQRAITRALGRIA